MGDDQIVYPGRELSVLDFEALIGGPFVATIHAQVQAAMATVNFVKAMGFERTPFADISPYTSNTGKPAYINFEFNKILPNGRPTQAQISIPFLTMLPIPSLRIDECSIEFNARINSTVARSVDTSVGLGFEAAASGQAAFATAGLKVSAVFQRQTKEGNVVTRDYSMSVRVKAVQDDAPAGIEKLLNILEASIQETDPTGAPLQVDGGGSAGGDAPAAPAEAKKEEEKKE
mmetsp:Transcript_13330/g.33985  ORF Transcript_13330/g.33985 Transcript_13330/m.33985 type:complete len:231 (+) Transcript_13330:123-815(+)|eukprot:CAMPEP_0177648508 /NCGR_PEP_ID=MMETSP0447-20121125/10864_1 /TAXON_ID=0 /ORGANISM="Stygamoeba regulata, Strain BSH-02190019" /LENGTH=230 /DNA_ID=CAMNT_0019151151 /DNA_START=120 /DNA_END=812 /DNA_ORIENTATION=-